jgi:hypothetical protein
VAVDGLNVTDRSRRAELVRSLAHTPAAPAGR